MATVASLKDMNDVLRSTRRDTEDRTGIVIRAAALGGSGGGAGRGSSFVEPSALGSRMYRGSKNNTGNGYITIQWDQ
jgi:hypothetical protein